MINATVYLSTDNTISELEIKNDNIDLIDTVEVLINGKTIYCHSQSLGSKSKNLKLIVEV